MLKSISTLVLFFVCKISFAQLEIKEAYNELNSFWSNKFYQKNYPFSKPRLIYYNQNNPSITKCGSKNDLNFFYCSLDNSISISLDFYMYLDKNGYNNGLIYYAIAHEYGHAIENLLRNYLEPSFLSIDKELRADCLAGVFYNYLDKQNRVQMIDIANIAKFHKNYSIENKGINQIFDCQAHGNLEQRMNSFTIGLNNGSVNQCYISNNTGGNISQSYNDMTKNLNELLNN